MEEYFYRKRKNRFAVVSVANLEFCFFPAFFLSFSQSSVWIKKSYWITRLLKFHPTCEEIKTLLSCLATELLSLLLNPTFHLFLTSTHYWLKNKPHLWVYMSSCTQFHRPTNKKLLFVHSSFCEADPEFVKQDKHLPKIMIRSSRSDAASWITMFTEALIDRFLLPKWNKTSECCMFCGMKCSRRLHFILSSWRPSRCRVTRRRLEKHVFISLRWVRMNLFVRASTE